MPEVNEKELGVGEEKNKIEETSANLREAVAVAECHDQQVQSQAGESNGTARDPAGGAVDCACKRYGIEGEQAHALFIYFITVVCREFHVHVSSSARWSPTLTLNSLVEGLAGMLVGIPAVYIW